MKETLDKLKELWKIPRYKALIQLGLYLLFFTITFGFMYLIGIISGNKETIAIKTPLENYKEMVNYEYTYNIKINNIDNNITGTKYNDKNEFKYLNNEYYINNKLVYSKKTNEQIDKLINFDILFLDQNNLFDLMTNYSINNKKTVYNNNNSKTEYTISYNSNEINMTTYIEDNYINKITISFIDKTDINIEIVYDNINNIRSYD